MDVCPQCRGTGIKPEPMQAELFDHALGRFCSCPNGQSKWQNILNCLSSSQTKTTRSTVAYHKPAPPYSGAIKIE